MAPFGNRRPGGVNAQVPTAAHGLLFACLAMPVARANDACLTGHETAVLERDWRSDLSLRAGVQLEESKDRAPEVQVLLEYFRSRNPNGQFYERRLKYLGLGLQVHF